MTTDGIMNALEAAGGPTEGPLAALIRGLLDGDDSGKMHEQAAEWLNNLH